MKIGQLDFSVVLMARLHFLIFNCFSATLECMITHNT